jgi:peptidoglycan-N-acetylglucosamine deacetylase
MGAPDAMKRGAVTGMSSACAHGSPAMMAGFAAFLGALILSFIRLEWAALPLTVFVLTCLGAPLFPSAGFFLPIISRGCTGRHAVSLTFDDGPDPAVTTPLLGLLARYQVKATFFVTGRKAEQYGDLLSVILRQGHTLGNHSFGHDPFLMLRSYAVLDREIGDMQAVLRRFGVLPLAFRPPVGVTSPKLAIVLRRRGMYCLNFSCRAGDFGNRYVEGLSGKILKKVKPDDIILLHDIRPLQGMAVDAWLREVDLILSGLNDRGLEIVPLADLIGKPVMIQTNSDYL